MTIILIVLISRIFRSNTQNYTAFDNSNGQVLISSALKMGALIAIGCLAGCLNSFSRQSEQGKLAKKRSLCAINEHFEPVFNAVLVTKIEFQQRARLCGKLYQP